MGNLIDRADFEELSSLAMSDSGRAHMRPVVQQFLIIEVSEILERTETDFPG